MRKWSIKQKTPWLDSRITVRCKDKCKVVFVDLYACVYEGRSLLGWNFVYFGEKNISSPASVSRCLGQQGTVSNPESAALVNHSEHPRAASNWHFSILPPSQSSPFHQMRGSWLSVITQTACETHNLWRRLSFWIWCEVPMPVTYSTPSGRAVWRRLASREERKSSRTSKNTGQASWSRTSSLWHPASQTRLLFRSIGGKLQCHLEMTGTV